MASTTAFAGKESECLFEDASLRDTLSDSIARLVLWLRRNDYRGYDTFDGLSARFVRPLTFENKFLRTVLQQGVRRFPLNLRPFLGVKKSYSSKAMGFMARGYMRLLSSTNDPQWAGEATQCLQWLISNQSRGFHGACWGNHFDYQSRGFYLPKGMPTVVWTSLIGHAFLDAFLLFNTEQYLQIAVSACESILSDLIRVPDGDGACISYIPGTRCLVHNANTLGASLLARTHSYAGGQYLEVARKALQYTAQYQHPDGSWWYGERDDMHWVDNFHTAYVLDCFKMYRESTGDEAFAETISRGYQYWVRTFFLPDGTPKYYNHKLLPIDIQCASQAIDTLVYFRDSDSTSVSLATKVALWTIRNMQDPDGHFYYRRYNSWLVNKTPTLHWGQATMLCALAGLYGQITSEVTAA